MRVLSNVQGLQANERLDQRRFPVTSAANDWGGTSCTLQAKGRRPAGLRPPS